MANDDEMSTSSQSSSTSSGGSQGQQEQEEEDAWEDWVDDEAGEGGGQLGLPTRCLLSDEVLPGVEAALARDRERGLDLIGLIASHGLGLYGAIKLINYIRSMVRDGRQAEAVLAAVQDPDALGAVVRGLGAGGDDNGRDDEDEERYLRPVLDDDPLLYALGELLEAHGLALAEDDDEEEGKEEGGAIVEGAAAAAAAARLPSLEEEEEQGAEEGLLGLKGLKGLRAENGALRAEVAVLRARVQRMGLLMAEMDADVKVPRLKKPDNDTYYFSSYGHYAIHETMLRDAVRTLAYKEAVDAHASALLRGRTVLDVGCGTGVLSMFAAKAGAARVVGVDRSDIIETARAIVARNGLDGAVALVKGKVEELGGELAGALGPAGKADVIVSEWMGYCLLYESMLPSVLEARDRFLAPGGWLMPNRCTMRVEGVRDLGGRLAWWKDVYGLDMAPLRAPMVAEPAVECVDPQAVMTDGCVFLDLDLMTVRTQDLDFGAAFRLAVTKGGAPLAGLVVSFDTFFEGPQPGDPVVIFSTGPEATDTHWRQTLFWLDGAPEEALAEGDAVEGRLQFTRNAENPRDYDIEVQWAVRSAGGKLLGDGQQKYQLGT